tara:strand:- start:176 stop:691 length:516 start_codon:yes stop_codon:yes gene_type:complete
MRRVFVSLCPLRTLSVLALAFALTGCGYQLRGSGGLPEAFSQVFLKARTTPMYQAMAQLLESSGATLVAQKDARVSILITQEDFKERLLSVDPNTGRAREFEIAYIATFSVRDQAGKATRGKETVRIVRDYVFDVDAVIGKSRERGVLYNEMRRDAAQQIFQRLRAESRQG